LQLGHIPREIYKNYHSLKTVTLYCFPALQASKQTHRSKAFAVATPAQKITKFNLVLKKEKEVCRAEQDTKM
jgi:hypothetical protein